MFYTMSWTIVITMRCLGQLIRQHSTINNRQKQSKVQYRKYQEIW